MHLEKVTGPGEVSFHGCFFLLTLLSCAKYLSRPAVPPIIIEQASHARVIQSFNLFDYFFCN